MPWVDIYNRLCHCIQAEAGNGNQLGKAEKITLQMEDLVSALNEHVRPLSECTIASEDSPLKELRS